MLIDSLAALLASVRARSFAAAVVAALMAASFATSSSFAQSTQLSPVVVTGSREPLPLDRLVGDVVVLDPQQIRDSSAASVEDIVSRAGGIQLSRNGGPGQSASVLLRGNGAGNVVVLIDGVRFGSASLGQADLAGLSLAAVERIEILRGPGSSLYGADAVGGVVQIITKRGAGGPNVAAHLAVGELQSSEADFSVNGVSGDVDYAAGIGREASDGVSALRPNDAFGNFNPDRDGFSRTHAQARGGLTFAPEQRIGASLLQTRLRSQYDGAEFLPPNFTQDAAPDFRNRFDVRVASLDYRGVFSPLWTSSAQFSQQRDDLLSGANAPDRFNTERQQLTWQNAFTLDAGQQLVAAVERLNEAVDSSSFTTRLKRHNSALVLGYSGQFGAHKLQADARHDRNSVYGGVSTGKLGYAFDLMPGLTLRAVAGSAFRGVSFNDLYFPGFGVPTVRPERSRSIEFGVLWREGDSTASATIYRNQVRDLIGFEPDRSFCPGDPSYDFGCARNTRRARLSGATLSAAQRFGDFGLRATLDFLNPTDSDSGERLVRRAAHQQSVVADWASGAWGVDATLVGVGARPEGGATLAAYQTLDLQLRYRFDAAWRVEAKLLNAFDRQYEPARDYQAVGRQAWIGVRFQSAGL